MHKVCILTDSSVQFTQSGFLGNELVFTLPFLNKAENKKNAKDNLVGLDIQHGIEPPPVREIIKKINQLHGTYSVILVIMASSAISELFFVVEEAIKQTGDPGSIKLIDSHTTSIGLGVLVQMAARLISLGTPFDQVEHQLRISVTNIYTLFCLPNLSNLAAANFLSNSQAVVGEMLGVLPIFSLEGGNLKSIQKVRTHRHLLDTFQEFLDEFEDPFIVALIKKSSHIKTGAIKDYVKSIFPRTNYGEYSICDPLVDLLGKESVGLIVIEDKLGNDFPAFSRLQ